MDANKIPTLDLTGSHPSFHGIIRNRVSDTVEQAKESGIYPSQGYGEIVAVLDKLTAPDMILLPSQVKAKVQTMIADTQPGGISNIALISFSGLLETEGEGNLADGLVKQIYVLRAVKNKYEEYQGIALSNEALSAVEKGREDQFEQRTGRKAKDVLEESEGPET